LASVWAANDSATVVTNRIGARLCAVVAADLADLMLWQSPATWLIKRRAVERGLRFTHYAKIMRGWHPAHNLAGISPDSVRARSAYTASAERGAAASNRR
jgi:hypothetical protein